MEYSKNQIKSLYNEKQNYMREIGQTRGFI